MDSKRDSAPNSLQQVLDFLCQLEAHNIGFSLEHNREETIMVLIAVPGERWEVEFFADGAIEVEIFGPSGGVLAGAEARATLDKLFTLWFPRPDGTRGNAD